MPKSVQLKTEMLGLIVTQIKLKIVEYLTMPLHNLLL